MSKNYDDVSSDEDDKLVGDQSPSIGLAIDKGLRSKELLTDAKVNGKDSV